jgi:serine/threonine protein kinase/pimeloyl-ACP methyl ester carboxylesterase/Flp pilus assembly protein TadD
MQQEIRFCHAPDGVRIAYAIAGSGPPLVKAANWLNHLEFDWQSPLWRNLFEDLASHYTLVRYDERGNGLSDWNAADLSFESFVRDLETVVDAAGLDRFPLLGISQGGAVALDYTVRHPQRVSQLILLGAYAKGWAVRNDPADAEKREAMITLIRQGWGQDNPAFRQMWSTLYIPEGTREQVDWFNELQRISTSPENAVRLIRTVGSIDVAARLPLVQAPTLVLHCRGDAAVPFEAGRLMAARIPGARFVELPGNNHLPMEGTPAWERFRDELHAFLGSAPRSRSASSDPVAARSPSGSGESMRRGSRWLPGAEVGPYRITSALGAGGMGVVYRARDTRLERDVALKVLPEDMVADATARARLLREARTASALNHPNICHIYDVGEFGGHSYIAMEHVEGRPLSQSIPADGLPLDTTLRYAEQLAEALAHAHDRGVLHRDLKSSNVMIMPEGRVKVLDFGLAKRAPANTDEATRAIDSVTQAGSVAGTLHYLAPELLRGQPADARSDLWALGVTLYEMVTGKLPFTGRTGFEASAAILREPPAPLPAHVPAGLRSVLMRCLAKEPAQRYQRAGELRAALEAIRSDFSFKLESHAAAFVAPAPARPASSESVSVARQTPFAATSPAYSTHGKPSLNREANEYFDKAVQFIGWGRQDPAQANKMLERALQLDPQFAEAQALHAFLLWMVVDGGESNDVGLLHRAHQELRQALQSDPHSVNANASLAAVFLAQGKIDAARAATERALQGNPDDLKANFMRMRIHWWNGEYDQAMAIAREALQRVPLFWPGRLCYGQMLREEGRLMAAAQELERGLEQDPANAWLVREMARVYIDGGDLAEARQVLQGVWPVQGHNFRIRLHWALLLALEGKKKEALREVDAEVVKYVEANAVASVTLAEFYACVGDTEQALKWLDRAVRAGDERAAWFRRDPLLAGIRHHPRFQQILDSIALIRPESDSGLQLQPLDAAAPAEPIPAPAPAPAGSGVVPPLLPPQASATRESWSVLGIWLAWLLGLVVLFGAFIAVTQWLSSPSQPASGPSSAVTQPPPAPDGPRLSTGGKPSPNAEANAYYERGINFIFTRYELAGAIQMFQKALELDAKFAEARAWYAFVLMLQLDEGYSNDTKWLYEAERELQRAAADDPQCGRVHSVLAGLYFRQGRKELVPAALEKARALNPDDIDVPIQQLIYHQLNGDYEKAKALARQLIEGNPLFWVPHQNLGDILREEGDYQGARASFQKVMDQDPRNIVLAKSLTRLALETGDLREARRLLEGLRPADRANYVSRLSLALLLAAEGKRRDALRQMDADLLKFADANKFFTLEAAEFYALLGDTDKALEWLDRAVSYGDERAEWFQRNPLLASVRKHPRFQQILDSIAFRRQQKNQ